MSVSHGDKATALPPKSPPAASSDRTSTAELLQRRDIWRMTNLGELSPSTCGTDGGLHGPREQSIMGSLENSRLNDLIQRGSFDHGRLDDLPSKEWPTITID
jgi:hypothetical protein